MEGHHLIKHLLTVFIVQAGVIAAFGQGAVNFANTTTAFGNDGIDRYVYVCNGESLERLTGTNYVAALYYGVSAASLNSFAVRSLEDQSLASAVGHFRVQTSASAGTWVGGLRYLPGIDVGQTVQLQIRIWDFNLFATYAEAVAQGGFSMHSDVFPYLATTPDDTAGLAMRNLRSFLPPEFSCVPEPSTLAIVGFGLVAFICVHRSSRGKQG